MQGRDNMNTGGRKKFPKDSRVRVLMLTGQVSSEVYLVSEPPQIEEGAQSNGYVRADRKGHIYLRSENGSKQQKVHFRRVLPVEIDGKAPVIESNDKYKAVCPTCGRVFTVDPNDTTIDCADCGKTPVYWLGVKPMTSTATKDNQTQDSKPSKDKEKTPSSKPTAKPEKAEPVKVDFEQLKSLDNCELWTKSHVKFDHAEVDVKAHVLLYNGDEPRKLCFNTYDGALGKKSPPLPIDEFLADGTVTSGKRQKPWYSIKNLDKTKEKLAKDGYEQVG